MKVTFEQFKNSEDATLSLNSSGVEYLKELVQQYANFEWTGDYEQAQELSTNDAGFDNDGGLNLELGAIDTKDGTPFTYTLYFDDHFDCIIND